MTEHSERGLLAKSYFEQGYNCSQSILLAFPDVTGLDDVTAAKLASSFGGGMGRMREVCGAVSGMYLLLGIAVGYSEPSDKDGKAAQYAVIRELADRFKQIHGSIVCRDMLAGVTVTPGGVPEDRTPDYYKKRPCPEIIADAADIIYSYFVEIGVINNV